MLSYIELTTSVQVYSIEIIQSRNTTDLVLYKRKKIMKYQYKEILTKKPGLKNIYIYILFYKRKY